MSQMDRKGVLHWVWQVDGDGDNEHALGRPCGVPVFQLALSSSFCLILPQLMASEPCLC